MKLNSTLIIIFLLIAIIVITGCSKNSNPAQIKITDARYVNISYLISGDTLDAKTQAATTGFNINKVVNSDGTTTIKLTSSNPEYKNQTYTLQSGQNLYFIESNLGDDSNNTDRFLGDDTALITDKNGIILNAPPERPNNTQGRFNNMTDAQRQQLNQEMTDACNGKAENDSCSVTTPNGNENGTCISRNDTLRCAVRFNGPRLPPT